MLESLDFILGLMASHWECHVCFQKIPVAAKLNMWKKEVVLQVREGGDSEPRVIVMKVVGVQI